MKNISIIALTVFLLSCNLFAQVDIAKLSPAQWKEDLSYFEKELKKRHVNLFHTMKEADFTKAISQLRNRIDSLNSNEIMVELIKIAAMVRDGHTDVAPISETYQLRFAYFDNGIYVTSAAKEYADAVGGKVVKVGNKDIDKVVEQLIPLVDGDNEMEIPRKVPVLLGMANILQGLRIIDDPGKALFTIITDRKKEVVLSLKPQKDSNDERVSVITKANSKPAMYLENTQENYWYRYLPQTKTLYFQYNLCNDQKGKKSISEFSKELFDFVDKTSIEYFVVDLRHNPGGNFLKSKPLVSGIASRPSINKKGKLFVFTTLNTGSAATVTGAMLKTQTEATIVGELSRANPNFTYNAESFYLPNSKLRVGYTESLHKPFPQLGKTLPVDINVENSLDDLRKGRDRFMEAIR